MISMERKKGYTILMLVVALLIVVLILTLYYSVHDSVAGQINAELDKGRQQEVSGSPFEEISRGIEERNNYFEKAAFG